MAELRREFGNSRKTGYKTFDRCQNAESKGWRTKAIGVRPAFLCLNLFDK